MCIRIWAPLVSSTNLLEVSYLPDQLAPGPDGQTTES